MKNTLCLQRNRKPSKMHLSLVPPISHLNGQTKWSCYTVWFFSIWRLMYIFYFFSRHIPVPADIPVRRREHSSVHSHLHGQRTEKDRKSLFSFFGYRRSFRGITCHDVRRRERSARVLDLRGPVLRHLGRIRRDVFDSQYIEFMCHIIGSIYSYKRPLEVRVLYTKNKFRLVLSVYIYLLLGTIYSLVQFTA